MHLLISVFSIWLFPLRSNRLIRPTKRGFSVPFVSLLYNLSVACSSLKQRFSLLIQNPAHITQRTVYMIERRFCCSVYFAITLYLRTAPWWFFNRSLFRTNCPDLLILNLKTSKSPTTEINTGYIAPFSVQPFLSLNHNVSGCTVTYCLYTVWLIYSVLNPSRLS